MVKQLYHDYEQSLEKNLNYRLLLGQAVPPHPLPGLLGKHAFLSQTKRWGIFHSPTWVIDDFYG